ncbi:hypothetical protein AB0O01_29920 [Streptomyces sp. NPDC093252]|uniref:hypothetical protein n=1 Tax=Streptomyces sp. NPDC093252 TaxID=3154980 RepID=UPI003439D454
MNTTAAGSRSAVLGRLIKPGVPLGPFEGTRFPGFTTATGTGRIHAVEDCPLLRKASEVRAIDFALDMAAAERLCSNWSCRWELPGGRWSVFLDTLSALSLQRLHEDDKQKQLPTEEEVAEAAAVLSQGEYPADEDDADAWERHEAARACRANLVSLWRDTQSRLVAAEKGLTECPWLRPWAEEWTAAHVLLVERQRLLVARFCDPRALAEAAAVPSLPQPVLTPETAFGIFGPDAASVLLRTWRAWCTDAQWGAKPLVEAVLSAQLAFHEAVGRRRKGRDEAEQSLERLTEAWAEQAREAAAMASVGKPWSLIGVEIRPTGPYTHGAGTHKVLTDWESAVLAVYQVAVDWRRSTAALWVPQGIGEQLLAEEGAMGATDLLREAEDWAAPASALLMAWDPKSSAGTA